MSQPSVKDLASRTNFLLAMGAVQIAAFSILALLGRDLYENAVSWNHDYPNHPMNTWMPLAIYRGCELILVAVALNVANGIRIRLTIAKLGRRKP